MTKKISLNIQEDVLNEVKQIGVKLSHSTLSETLNYLLTKAVYLEKEDIIASTVQNYFRGELNRFREEIIDKISLSIEEVIQEQTEELNAQAIKDNKIIYLANLIIASEATTLTDEEAVEVRENALQEAYLLGS